MGWMKKKKFRKKIHLQQIKQVVLKIVVNNLFFFLYFKKKKSQSNRKATALQYSKQVGLCNTYVWTFYHMKTESSNREQ